MKLYEIDKEIEDLENSIQVDEETGEVTTPITDGLVRMEHLQVERRKAQENIAKAILNLRAESAAVKAEEARLRKRRDTVDRKAKYLLDLLDVSCDGIKTDFGVATVYYRASSKLEVTDMEAALNALESRNHYECIRYREAELAKDEVKRLIRTGEKIPGCNIKEQIVCSLR